MSKRKIQDKKYYTTRILYYGELRVWCVIQRVNPFICEEDEVEEDEDEEKGAI